MSYNPGPPSSSSRTFPPADHPILAELVDAPRGPRIGAWLAAFVAVFLVGIACVLVAVWFVPKELQQWRLASAEEQRLNGDPAGAMQKLNQDITRNPRNIELRRTKSQWLLEDKQYQSALKEINQIVTWRPGDVDAYVQRTVIHQFLGEFDKAVEDWKRILSFDAVSAGRGRAGALNGLAYARALANIEIDEGLASVDEAMRMAGENYQMLDTRGFLYYRKGDFDRALKDLDNAVDYAEAEYSLLSSTSSTADRRLKKLEDKQRAQTLAVVRYHRALIHEGRKQTDQAEADYQRVRELGFEPSASLF